MFKLTHNVTEIGTYATDDAAKEAAEKHELHDGHPIPWGREYKIKKTMGKGKDADGNEIDVVVKQEVLNEVDPDIWVGGWWRIDKV